MIDNIRYVYLKDGKNRKVGCLAIKKEDVRNVWGGKLSNVIYYGYAAIHDHPCDKIKARGMALQRLQVQPNKFNLNEDNGTVILFHVMTDILCRVESGPVPPQSIIKAARRWLSNNKIDLKQKHFLPSIKKLFAINFQNYSYIFDALFTSALFQLLFLGCYFIYPNITISILCFLVMYFILMSEFLIKEKHKFNYKVLNKYAGMCHKTFVFIIVFFIYFVTALNTFYKIEVNQTINAKVFNI
jgi:hypothetical protein